MPQPRSAALVLRVWTDEGADTFRCRITRYTDVTDRESADSDVVASLSAALAIVGRWLDQVAPG